MPRAPSAPPIAAAAEAAGGAAAAALASHGGISPGGGAPRALMDAMSHYIGPWGVMLCAVWLYSEQIYALAREELEHFHQVLGMLKKRGIPFRRLTQSNYGRQMKELIRPQEPDRAVDRLLVAALIEARSCERFDLLRHHIDDVELSDFYDELFESEARHYSVYVQLAEDFGTKREVELRLQELARAEAQIINRGDTLPRMHS